MEPEELLKQFSASNKSMEDAIVTMKKSLQEKEKELAEVRAQKAVVQTKNEEMQRLLDRAKGSIKKKNGKKAVRLTAWVDPPSPSPEAVRKM